MCKNGICRLHFTASSGGDLISSPTSKEYHSMNKNSPMLRLSVEIWSIWQYPTPRIYSGLNGMLFCFIMVILIWQIFHSQIVKSSSLNICSIFKPNRLRNLQPKSSLCVLILHPLNTQTIVDLGRILYFSCSMQHWWHFKGLIKEYLS